MADRDQILEAFVKWSSDESEFLAGTERVRNRTRQTADEALATTKTATTGLVDQYGRVIVSAGAGAQAVGALSTAETAAASAVKGAVAPTVDWTKALGEGVGAGEAVGMSARQMGSEISHSGRLLTEFSRALGINTPVLMEMEKGISGAARGLKGFGLEAVGVGIAVIATAAALGYFIQRENALIDTQLAANKAVETMDTGAAQSALEAVAQKADAYIGRVRMISDESSGTWRRVVAFLGAAITDHTKLAEEMRITGEAADRTWQEFGKGQAILTTNRSSAEAAANAYRLMSVQAASISGVDAALKGVADSTRAAALAAVDAAENEDRQYRAKQQHLIDAQRDLLNFGTANKMQADLEEEMAQRAIQRTNARANAQNAYTQTRIADDARIGQMRQREMEDEAKLEETQTRRMQAAIRGSGEEADARQRVLEADSQFYGTSVSNLDAYQAHRRAVILAEAALELQAINQRYERERAALQTLASSQTGTAATQTYRQMTQAAEDHAAKVEALSTKTRTALIADAGKTTEEQRALYARELAMSEGYYKQLEQLGQGDVAGRLRQLEAIAGDERASYEKRVQALTESYAMRRQLETDFWNLLRAGGLTTERDAVAHAAKVAESWKEGSSERLRAETDFVSKVKSMWADLSGGGKDALGTVSTIMKEDFGIANASLSQMQAYWPRIVQGAQQTVNAMAMGLPVTDRMRERAEQVANLMGTMTQRGVTFGQEVGAHVLDLGNKLSGIPTSADKIVGEMGQLGIKTGDAAKLIVDMTGDIHAAADAMGGDLLARVEAIPPQFEKAATSAESFDKAVGNASQSAERLRGALGAGEFAAFSQALDTARGSADRFGTAFDTLSVTVPGAFREAFGAVPGLVDSAMETINERVRSGISRIGESVARGIIDQVRQMLQYEANAS